MFFLLDVPNTISPIFLPHPHYAPEELGSDVTEKKDSICKCWRLLSYQISIMLDNAGQSDILSWLV